jgi:hypothetical protein
MRVKVTVRTEHEPELYAACTNIEFKIKQVSAGGRGGLAVTSHPGGNIIEEAHKRGYVYAECFPMGDGLHVYPDKNRSQELW